MLKQGKGLIRANRDGGPQLFHFRAADESCFGFHALATVVLIGILLRASLAQCQPSAGSARGLDYAVEAALDGDIALLPVCVAGRRYDFLVDTGSNFTVYDSTLLPLLGKSVPTEARLNGRPAIMVNAVSPDNVFVGPFAVRCQSFDVDLSPLRQASGRDFYGVIGMDFLVNYRLTLDPDRNLLTLSDSCEAIAGSATPLHFFDGRPYIETVIQGWGQQFFMIDSGATGVGCLPPHLANRIRRIGSGVPWRRDLASYSIHGSAKVDCLKLRKMSVASFPLTDMRLYSGEFQESLLGMGLWCRFVTSFDFPNQKIYLRASHLYAHPCTGDVSGLNLIRKHGAIVVESVEQGSPAGLAGIQPGDQIRSIGELDASIVRLHELRLKLTESGKTVAVVFTRGDRSCTVTLKLHAWWQATKAPQSKTQGQM